MCPTLYNAVTDSSVLCKETFIWNNVPYDKRGKLLPIGGAAYTCNSTTHCLVKKKVVTMLAIFFIS